MLTIRILLITSFMLVSCSGGGGGSPAEPAPIPLPTVSISADPINVFVDEEVTITWSSSNASSCEASESWQGTKGRNGEEALQLIEDSSPDLVILDWMMPNMSGIDLCRSLRSRSETKYLPIIILSARSEDSDKSLGLDSGADDYISKRPVIFTWLEMTYIP